MRRASVLPCYRPTVSGSTHTTDQCSSGGIRRRTLEKELALKRVTLIASALCFTLGAFSALAEDKMEKKADKMGHSDKMEKPDRMAKKDKMAKHDKMDRMQKPGAAE